MNHVPYEMPSDMGAAIATFVGYYNYRFYHKVLGNVTPSDALRGRREDILRRRKEVKAQTIERRRQHNRDLREFQLTPAELARCAMLPCLLEAEQTGGEPPTDGWGHPRALPGLGW